MAANIDPEIPRRALIGPDLVRQLPAANVDIRDTKIDGYMVRCRASGVHSYIVRLGRGDIRTIGRVGKMQPESARLTADALVSAVSRDTIRNMADDPSLKIRDARTKARGAVRGAKRRRVTWKTFLDDEYGPWVEQNRKTGDETLERLRMLFTEWDEVPLSELSSFSIERWRSGRLKAGLKPATCNRDLASLRGALTKAVEWRFLKTHPMATVKAAKIDTVGPVRYLSDDEEKQLRTALTARDVRRREERDRANEWRREREYEELPEFGVYTDHLHPIVLLALNTGCRRGELLDLRWQDVDLAAARLTVRAENAKSGFSRVVPLNTEGVSVLKDWLQGVPDPSAYVFPAADGERMQDLKTAFLTLIRDEAKIAGFRFHDLRHSFASKLVQAGVDLNRLRALLGHADTKMVLRYAHLRDEDLAAAVAKLVSA